MIADNKLFSYYERAKNEFSHPDPEKAVFGRAALSGRKSDYAHAGKVGLFAISQKRAEALGWDELSNPDQNFLAAMDLDMAGYTENEGDLFEMYAGSAGITGGVQKKNAFNEELDEAYNEIKKTIKYNDGVPYDLSGGDVQKEKILDESGDGDIKEDVKRASAQMRHTIAGSFSGKESFDADVQDALQLLREYVDRLV